MPKRKKIFYGWWMVLASAILNVLAGGTFYYGFTIFFNPIRTALGLSAAVTSIAFAFKRLEEGLLGPVAGFLIDRVAPRKLMLFGWGVAGLGFLLMSRVNSLWEFYATFLTIAMGFSMGSFLVISTTIARWFNRKRSRALTFVYVGFGVSGTLVPLLALLISRFGWRTSLVVAGIVLWVVGIPVSLLIRNKPEQYGYLPDGETPAAINEPANTLERNSSSGVAKPASGSSATGFTVKAALRTRAYWLLAMVFFFQQIGTSAIMVHIVPYLESLRVPTGVAALAVTGMTLCSLIGRIGFGFLGDFKNKRYLIAIALTLQTVGIFIFSLITADRTWLIIPFLLTYGPGYGGPIPLRPALQADYFGTRSFGTLMGLWAVVSMVGGLASPVIAGWLFDTTGSYHKAWQLFTLTTAPAIALILLAKPPVTKPENNLT